VWVWEAVCCIGGGEISCGEGEESLRRRKIACHFAHERFGGFGELGVDSSD
jgi:hypothetical protein